MSKSSSPSARRRDQLDSLYWAGRAKQLGLTPSRAVRKAQLDAEALARVTARITHGTANEPRPKLRFDKTVLDKWYEQLRASIRKTERDLCGMPAGTIRRPARYTGKSASFMIIDDLTP